MVRNHTRIDLELMARDLGMYLVLCASINWLPKWQVALRSLCGDPALTRLFRPCYPEKAAPAGSTACGALVSWQCGNGVMRAGSCAARKPIRLCDPRQTWPNAIQHFCFFNRLVYILVCIKVMLSGNVMKIQIGSYEAKTKLPELLRQVKSGKSFTITNRGEAIADLVPSVGAKVKDKVAAAEKLKAFMLADPVRGVDIKALIDEGRA
jgi:prevent-host-death family protein